MSRAAPRLAWAVFAAQFVLLDVALRGAAVAHDRGWIARGLLSTILWALVARAATSRVRELSVAVLASAVLVLTVLVFRYYHAALDARIVASAMAAFRDVRPVLVRAAPGAAAGVALVAALELALLRLLHRTRRPRARRRPRALARVVPAVAGLVVVPFAGGDPRATPDLRALHALGALRPPPPAARTGPPALLPLPSTRATVPDVLVVLTESVRASDYTASRSARTRAALQRRAEVVVDLRELRSVASYTALSLSALMTGQTQEGDRTAIRASPTLFTFARAVRGAAGERMSLAYVAGQSATVFETDEVERTADRFVTVETLIGHDVEDDSDYTRVPLDRLAVERFEREVASTVSPRFALLHLVSTHAPYFVDPDDAPSKPYAHVVTWSGLGELHAAYENAIVAQDASVARAIDGFVAGAGSRPWLVVFTSDHGEAFGEHGAIHHGQNLYDEQVRVPGFVAAGNGALAPAAIEALRRAGESPTTHLDLLPTVLDALGVLDHEEIASARARLAGRSLLRDAPGAPSPIPLTNCTAMFPCPVETWGMAGLGRKVVAQPWDGALVCTSTEGTAELLADAHDPRCVELVARACAAFPRLPSGQPCR